MKRVHQAQRADRAGGNVVLVTGEEVQRDWEDGTDLSWVRTGAEGLFYEAHYGGHQQTALREDTERSGCVTQDLSAMHNLEPFSRRSSPCWWSGTSCTQPQPGRPGDRSPPPLLVTLCARHPCRWDLFSPRGNTLLHHWSSAARTRAHTHAHQLKVQLH